MKRKRTALNFRRFIVYRTEDVSGVSGTGIVAGGIEFDSGKVAFEWCTPNAQSSLAIHDNVTSLREIHGHEGKTHVVWIDDGAVDIKNLDLDKYESD